MKNTNRLASGRVVVKSPGEVAQDRYQFLDLASAEPNLGTASNGSVLTTTTTGDRVWTTNVSIANVTLTGNLSANAVYTENLFYANGQPFVTDTAASASNIFNGRVTATNAQTLIDSFDLTGVTSVRWILSATDSVNDAYKTSTIDSSNDTINIYYNESSIVLSNPLIEVASYYAEIDGSTIKLYATGTSLSVPVTFQRITLGSSTTVGNLQTVAYAATVSGTGTATVLHLDSFVGTGTDTAFTLTTVPTTKNQTLITIGGIVQPKSTYTLAGSTITFSSAPPTGAPIEIQTFATTAVSGYTGSRGIDGVIGYNGSTGYTGSAGSLGYTGSIGYTGSASPLSNWIKRTSNYTALLGDRIIADTGSGSFTVTLPASPTLGAVVKITDGNDFGANPLTIGANGNTIESQSNDVLVNLGKVDLELVYDGTTWQIISTMGPTGFTGSAGASGSLGYTGSAGAGFTGSAGYTGSLGSLGYTGSIGYTGSAGAGYTGSVGATGSLGYTGSIGYTGSAAEAPGYYGSAGGGAIAGNFYVSNEQVVMGNVYINNDLLPTANVSSNIGSPTRRWKDLYLSGSTIDLAGAKISVDSVLGSILLTPAPTPSNPNPVTATLKTARYITLTQPGTIATPFIGVARCYVPTNVTISNVYASLGTASSTSFQFAILKNGSSVATYTIDPNSNRMSVTSANINITSDDYITVNITSGTGATDLKVDLEYTS